MVIAIDGPAGAGKGTVARAVARVLGLSYLDTGALYRAVALAALKAGIPAEDGNKLGQLAQSLTIDAEGTTVWLEGSDVSEGIRSRDVTAVVPAVSAHPEVRRALVGRQRAAAENGDVVIEGRDIGAMVVPEADLKIFLTASVEERARRRLLQLGLAPAPETVRSIAAEIDERDRADAARESSPFRKPEGAVEIDSTDRSVQSIVDEIVALVRAQEKS